MPQQINLLTPILLTPKRYFSAQALLQATGLLALACLVAGLLLQQRDRRAEAEHQALLARYASERQQLTAARAGLPTPQDASALQQQLQALQAGNEERRALLRALGAEAGSRPAQRHSELLALIARTLPEAAWLSELRYAPGRVEIVGGTLDTGVLRPWLDRIAAHPLLAGQELSALRVERLGAGGPDAAPRLMLARSATLASAGLPVWGFRVVSAPAGAASAVTPGAPR